MENENTLTEEEIEETFAAINQAKYEMSMEQLISNRFPEMIDFELNLYSKAYMYDYNAVHYGLNREVLQDMIDSFEGNISKYLKRNIDTADEFRHITISLKDKCLLCMPWNPVKFCKDDYSIGIKSYNLNFLEYKNYDYIYLKNMNIVFASSGGNHRLLLQSLQNNDIKAEVTELDDTELLTKFITDGGYLINKYDPDIKVLMPNYRLAIIFRLTQLKLGLN